MTLPLLFLSSKSQKQKMQTKDKKDTRSGPSFSLDVRCKSFLTFFCLFMTWKHMKRCISSRCLPPRLQVRPNKYVVSCLFKSMVASAMSLWQWHLTLHEFFILHKRDEHVIFYWLEICHCRYTRQAMDGWMHGWMQRPGAVAQWLASRATNLWTWV